MITKLARNCQLFLACHWHACSCNLTLTLRVPVDSLIWAPDTSWLLFYFLIKYWNSILDITHWPEFIAPSRWLWVSTWSKNSSEHCQSAHSQAQADEETGELVTDSQIDRGEVTADSSLPPSDIKHPAFSERDLSTVQFPVCGLRAYQCEVCNITHDIVSCAGIPRHFSSVFAVWCTGDITVAHKQERACGMWPGDHGTWSQESESHWDTETLRHNHNFRLSQASGVQVAGPWRRIMIIGWNLRSQSRNIIIYRLGY